MVWCSRENHAGALSPDDNGLFAHRMHGPCGCGTQHGKEKPKRIPQVDSEYDYRDENGKLLFQVVRFAGKEFRQRTPEGWGLNGARRVPYRLPELLASPSDARVFIVEGEKDVEAMMRHGLVATCNPGGAGKWRFVHETAKAALKGRTVTIIADTDEPGRSHARDVFASLHDSTRAVSIIECPGMKDAADFFMAGGTAEQLLDIAQKADPLPEPSPFKWRSWKDIAQSELPDVGWIVKDLHIGPGRPGQIQGFGGSGKSWVAMALALSVAAGVPFLGKYPVRQCKVAYVSHELGSRATASRFRRLANGMLLEPSQLEGQLQLSVFPKIYLNSPDAEEWYRKELAGVGLCIIDSFRRAVPGIDENDSRISVHLDMLAHLNDEIKTVFQTVMHSGKAVLNPDKSDGSKKKDERGSGRGSSAIEDASSTIWKIEGNGAGPRRFKQARPHDESEGEIADIWITMETVAILEPLYFTDGQPATRVVVLGDDEAERADMHSRRKGNIAVWQRNCREIVALVQESQQISLRQALRELGDSRSRRDAFDDLVEANVLTETTGAKNSRVFSMGVIKVDAFLAPRTSINTDNWFQDDD